MEKFYSGLLLTSTTLIFVLVYFCALKFEQEPGMTISKEKTIKSTPKSEETKFAFDSYLYGDGSFDDDTAHTSSVSKFENCPLKKHNNMISKVLSDLLGN